MDATSSCLQETNCPARWLETHAPFCHLGEQLRFHNVMGVNLFPSIGGSPKLQDLKLSSSCHQPLWMPETIAIIRPIRLILVKSSLYSKLLQIHMGPLLGLTQGTQTLNARITFWTFRIKTLSEHSELATEIFFLNYMLLIRMMDPLEFKSWRTLIWSHGTLLRSYFIYLI